MFVWSSLKGMLHFIQNSLDIDLIASICFGFKKIYPRNRQEWSSCHPLIPIPSNNKASEYNKLIIPTAEMGSRTFLIAHDGSMRMGQWCEKVNLTDRTTSTVMQKFIPRKLEVCPSQDNPVVFWCVHRYSSSKQVPGDCIWLPQTMSYVVWKKFWTLEIIHNL